MPEAVLEDARDGPWPGRSSSGSACEARRRIKQVQDAGCRQLFLGSCMLHNDLFPSDIFTFRHLVVLDLSYNNLNCVPDGIGELANLQELWANDNPLIQVPSCLCMLKDLRILDLRNSWLRNIPREYARLTKIQDINLENCPLKPTLSKAYAEGQDSLFAYLKRKDDRRLYKASFVRLLREEIYPFDPPEKHVQIGESVFAALKNCTSSDLDKLVRHCQRFLPKRLEDVSGEDLKDVIHQLNAEEVQRNEVGFLQLKLRAVYPELPLDLAHHYADQMQKSFSKEDCFAIIQDHTVLFPQDFRIVTIELLASNLKNLRTQRFDERLCQRILKCYNGHGGSSAANSIQASHILNQLLSSAAGDRHLVDKSLESSLPASLDEALELMAEYEQNGHTLPLQTPVADSTLNTQDFGEAKIIQGQDGTGRDSEIDEGGLDS